MTHADLLIELVAEYGRVSPEEAKFVFESFRSSFPGPEYMDRELSPNESEIMLNLYRKDQKLIEMVSQMMLQYHDRLPSA